MIRDSKSRPAENPDTRGSAGDETINAAMLATAIWIDAHFESDVGTFIARDNRFRCVAKILRRAFRFTFYIRIVVDQNLHR